MSKYLITGGSGFIGTNLVDYHILRGDSVLNFDIVSPKDFNQNRYFKKINILDESELLQAIKKFNPDYIYHLGARTDLDGLNLHDYRANTTGLINLIKCCDELENLQRVIFASSRLVCKIGYEPLNDHDYCPTTHYGESKMHGEEVVKNLKNKNWDWCIVRPTSIWGPWFSTPYKNFFDLVQRGLYFHPYNYEIFKSFGYVGNTVYQLEKLMHAKSEFVNGKVFYLGDYEPINMHTFAVEIANTFNVRKPLIVPLWTLRILAIVGNILKYFKLPAPLTTFRLNNLITPMTHNFANLKEVVGNLPFTTKEGIVNTISWIKDGKQ